MLAKTTIIVLLLSLITVSCIQGVIASAEQYSVSVIVKVYVDGSAKITYNVTVRQPPVQLSIPLLGEPFYVEAFSDNTSVPVEYNNTYATFTAVHNTTTIVYYTSNLTVKKGDEWTLTIHTPWRITVILPPEALVYEVSPEDFEPTIINGEVGFTFNPGTIEIKYIIIPSPIQSNTTQLQPTITTQTTSNQTSSEEPWILAAKTAVIIVVVLVIFYYIRLKRKETRGRILEELDERDRKIIELLAREGELTAQEIIEKTKIPKTPLYRRLKKLVSQGYLEAVNRSGKTYYRLRKPK